MSVGHWNSLMEAFEEHQSTTGPHMTFPEFYHHYTNKAEGGRVPLAEGNTPSAEQLQQYYEEIEKQKERERLQREFYEQKFGGPGPVLEAATGGLAGMLGE